MFPKHLWPVGPQCRNVISVFHCLALSNTFYFKQKEKQNNIKFQAAEKGIGNQSSLSYECIYTRSDQKLSGLLLL